MNDRKEDELYSSYILPNEASILLPSVEAEKKTEKKIVFENIDKDIYNTFDELDDLLFRTRRYLHPNLI